MLIKKTYAVIGGDLNNLFVIGLKIFEMSHTKLQEVKSLDSTKNGKSVGISTFAQIIMPLYAVSLYFCGLIAINAMIIANIVGINISKKLYFFSLCLTFETILM